MAYRHVYVDPDATGTPENGTTWDKAYATLNAAEQAEDNTGDIRATGGSNEIVVFHVRASAGTADTTAAAVSGWTTDSGGYIVIVGDAINTSYGSGSSETTGTARHAGIWTTGVYRLETSNAIALAIQEDYVRVDGIQIGKSSSSANLQVCVNVNSQAAANEIWVSNCIIRQAGNNSYTEPGFYLNDADLVFKGWNLIVYGHGTANSSDNTSMRLQAGTATVYSTTLIGGYNGLYVNSGTTCTAKNVYATGFSAGYQVGGTLTSTNCASSGTELSGTEDHDNVAYSTSTFASVTPGGATYLQLTSDGGLTGHGVDTSGESAPLNFTTDIAGTARSGAWEIGAFEYVAPAGGQPTMARWGGVPFVAQQQGVW